MPAIEYVLVLLLTVGGVPQPYQVVPVGDLESCQRHGNEWLQQMRAAHPRRQWIARWQCRPDMEDA